MNLIRTPSRQHGSSLIMTLLATSILAISIAAMLRLSTYSVTQVHGRQDWNEAFFHAENALSWGAQLIADAANTSAPLGTYSAQSGTLALSYMTAACASPNTRFENAWLTVDRPSGMASDVFRVTASCQVGDRVRTVQANIRKNPASEIFDYEYFLNNWGWWWGASISGYGDNRANWDFDFRYDPVVNGSVMANGYICENGSPVDPLNGSVPFRGLAATDPVAYVHSGAPRLAMPNLLDFSYYESKATSEGGQLSIGGTVLVDGIHTDATQPGLYLVGTDADPIEINGPVVIPGDVVIKGKITGQGTLYVGGHLYVAGNLTYLNGPNYSTAPSSLPTAQRDAWVTDNHSRDLVAFAVRESIYAGEVNSTEWKSRCYDPSGYGLKNVGSETTLGRDGIAHTGDDGVAYLDTNGDSTPDSAWFDADGDGAVDRNYNYDSDIKMTDTRASRINGYPMDTDGTPAAYSSAASNNMNRLDGIFYTNHAAAMRLATANAIVNGSIVSRDEAIIFNSTCKFVYDVRVHSRYAEDPNRFVDLGLPLAGVIRMDSFGEIPPVAGFYASN